MKKSKLKDEREPIPLPHTKYESDITEGYNL